MRRPLASRRVPPLACALALAAAWGQAAAQEDRFTVMGWVKDRVASSPEPAPSLPMAPHPGDLAAESAAAPAVVPVPSRPPLSPGSPAVASEAPRALPLPPGPSGPATVAELRRRAEFLSAQGLTYKFGAGDPSQGGMDCSGTMQFLLKSIGYHDVPRTSYAQYEWLRQKSKVRRIGFFHGPDRAVKRFRPGDLVFWGGTWDSGHKVSHVMVYLGQGRDGRHYMFGARSKGSTGLNGAGVDIFEYSAASAKRSLVGYGRLPGLRG